MRFIKERNKWKTRIQSPPPFASDKASS